MCEKGAPFAATGITTTKDSAQLRSLGKHVLTAAKYQPRHMHGGTGQDRMYGSSYSDLISPLDTDEPFVHMNHQTMELMLPA
eukprot:SAG31_NODE_774_length_12192_cov_26.736128_11_plen_82_part_00